VSLRKAADGALSTQALPPKGRRLEPAALELVRRAETALLEEAGG